MASRRELAQMLDAAIALAKKWKPNHAWPNVSTVMLTLNEAKALRQALITKEPVNGE